LIIFFIVIALCPILFKLNDFSSWLNKSKQATIVNRIKKYIFSRRRSHMVIFPIIIVISLVLYVYYKVAILKSKEHLTQAYFNAKSPICLGSFVFFLDINQYVYYLTTISLFICIVLLILGWIQLSSGFKQLKHYCKEWKLIIA